MWSQQELKSYPVVVVLTYCLLADEQCGVLFVWTEDALALLAHVISGQHSCGWQALVYSMGGIYWY